MKGIADSHLDSSRSITSVGHSIRFPIHAEFWFICFAASATANFCHINYRTVFYNSNNGRLLVGRSFFNLQLHLNKLYIHIIIKLLSST